MAFMIPIAEYFSDADVFAMRLLCNEMCPPEVQNARYYGIAPECEHRAQYVEEINKGWYARLSAPGYLDCTEWVGPYATEAEALAEIMSVYGVDENGDDIDNVDESTDVDGAE